LSRILRSSSVGLSNKAITAGSLGSGRAGAAALGRGSPFFLNGKGILVFAPVGFEGEDKGGCGEKSSSSPSSGVDGIGLFEALAPSGEPVAGLFNGAVAMVDATYGCAKELKLT